MKKILLTLSSVALLFGSAFATLSTPSVTNIGTSNWSAPKTLLNWNPVSNATYYKVQYDTVNSFNSSILTSATTPYTAYYTQNLYFNAKYYYRVKAYSNTDSSAWSTVDSLVSFNDQFSLTYPANGTLIKNVASFVKWTGLAGVTGIYQIQIDTSATFSSGVMQIINQSKDSTQIFIPELYFNTEYYWRIRASDAVDTSAWSSDTGTFFTPARIKLKSPDSASVKAMCDQKMTWYPRVGGVTIYKYQYDTTPNFNSSQLKASFKFHPDSTVNGYKLFFGQKYYWHVQAINDLDTSLWSTVYNYTVVDTLDQYYPGNGNDSLGTVTPELKWMKVTGIAKYQIEYAQNASFTGGTIINVSQDTLDTAHYTFATNLQKNVVYYWRVRAFHSLDTSAWSGAYSFMILHGLGIDEPKNEGHSFSLYPNPAVNNVQLRYKSKMAASANVKIYNILGKVVFNKAYGKTTVIDQNINTTDFKQGIYFVEFTADGTTSSKKLIITK